MNKCPKCGAELQEGAAFCTECGQKVDTAAPLKKKKTKDVAVVVGATAIAVVMMGVIIGSSNSEEVTPAASDETSVAITEETQTEVLETVDVSSMLSAVSEKRAEESSKKETAEVTEPADETEPVTVTVEEHVEESAPATKPVKEDTPKKETKSERDYVLNTNTMKFHHPSCSSVEDIKDYNREDFHGTRDEVIARGFEPCGRCKP